MARARIGNSRLTIKAVHCLTAICLAVPASASEQAGQATELWDVARKGGRFAAPTRDELRTAEDLFRGTLTDNGDEEKLKKAWTKARFEVLVEGQGDNQIWVIREQPDHKEGRGFYLIRRGKTPAIALQAPHGWNDLHTGPIAIALFREGKVRAAALNTVDRLEADLAHRDGTHFQAFTRAFAGEYPRGLIIQLHGFEAKKRKTEDAKEAGIIVSNGTKQPPEWLLDFAGRLKKDVEDVKVFPRDVRELGGTTNAQAKLLVELKHDGFAHLEIGLALRKQLRYMRAQRESFLNAVSATYDAARKLPK
jgi:hypothetical protein